MTDNYSMLILWRSGHLEIVDGDNEQEGALFIVRAPMKPLMEKVHLTATPTKDEDKDCIVYLCPNLTADSTEDNAVEAAGAFIGQMQSWAASEGFTQ